MEDALNPRADSQAGAPVAIFRARYQFAKEKDHRTIEPQMIGILKALFKDFLNPGIRYTYLVEFLRAVPGNFGISLRRVLMRRYFKRVGADLTIAVGARIFGPHNFVAGSRCFIGYDNTIQANGGVELGDDVVLGP